jgi:hypothetical protein
VIGSLDLRQALGAGEVVYEPGLLAAAHRGILYVDEVNLLHDHLVICCWMPPRWAGQLLSENGVIGCPRRPG